MTREEILKRVDHTFLLQTATTAQVLNVCEDAKKYGVASVCIPPVFVKRAAEYIAGNIPVCTVIGFPNGYNSSRVKVFECERALADGADEIDMVINIGMLKEGKLSDIHTEIKEIKEICGERILKVIIETCLLTDEEKIKMCEIVTKAGADFIKTSTGFSTGGATTDDIRLFARYVNVPVKIKAAGGIRSFDDAAAMLSAGASRLGTSALVKIMKNQAVGGY